ncbi:MAG: hypothetical protein CMD39_07300 [Gammaproteobacteria bacterium]|nr:hypothetical protein [Gammaproteobacteria bacterium]
MSHPIDEAAAALDHDEAVRHREYLERWASMVLGHDPSDNELRRARIMLDNRIRQTGALVPDVWQPPNRDKPVTVPCSRCRADRACKWDGWAPGGGTWVKPAPCDGLECGFLGQPDPIVPTVRGLEQMISDLRSEVWAFHRIDQRYAVYRAQELGALLAFVRTLEAIALDGDQASQELARAALALEAELLAPRMLTAQPEFDLEAIPNEDDETGPYPELVEPDPGPGPTFVLGKAPKRGRK